MENRITLLLLFLSSILYAQIDADNLVRYELLHDYGPGEIPEAKEIIQYSFNNLGERIRTVKYFWNENAEKVLLNQEKIYEYKFGNLVQLHLNRFDFDGNIYQRDGESYAFSNACDLVSENLSLRGGDARHRVTYEYEDCQLKTKYYWRGGVESWEAYKKLEFGKADDVESTLTFNRDNEDWLLQEELYVQKDANGNILRRDELRNINSALELYEYDAENRLTKATTYIGAFGNIVANLESEIVYEYDEKGNLSYEGIFVPVFMEDRLVISEEWTIENEYDENDWLIRQAIAYRQGYDEMIDKWWYTEDITIDYGYYCDGTLSAKRETSSKRNYAIVERFFPYKSSPCNQELDVNGALVLFPNPAETYLNVHHEILRSEDCQVALFDATGKLVNQYNYFQNASSANFDMEELPQGMYFLKLTAQEQSVTGKFFKL